MKWFMTAILCLTANSMSYLPQTKTTRQHYPIRYGLVSATKLADFVPDELFAACELLFQRKIAKAKPIFAKAYGLHPDDPSVFIGEVQCDFENLQNQISVLAKSFTATDQFKLGVLLFYRWGMSHPDNNTYADDVNKSRTLIQRAWDKLHQPVIGQMLIEVTEVAPGHHDVSAIRDALIKKLAGLTAWNRYKKSESSGWKLGPPSVELTHALNRRSLSGVLKDLWSLNSARTRVTTYVGNVI